MINIFMEKEINNFLSFSRHSFDFSCLEYEELLSFSRDPRFSNYFSLISGSVSSDSSAIIGDQGHIFINDGANKWTAQLLGHHSDVDNAFDGYKKVLENRRSMFRDMGISYKHLIIPEKDVLYPELNPNLHGVQLSENRVAVRLATSDLSDLLVYGETDLSPMKKYGFVFLKRNSHLNLFGGYFVAKSFFNSYGFDFPQLDEIKFKTYKWPDDLSMKFVDDLNTSRPVIVTDAKVTEISDGLNGGHVGRKVGFTNPSASLNKKLLIFGDSYAWNPDAGLARFASVLFQEVLFVWSTSVDINIVRDFKPDFVVTESAERFHIKPPIDIN